MSADDAEDFIGSVVKAFGGPFALHQVVVFVDFHEDNVRSGTSFVQALTSVDVPNFERNVVRCRLDAADYIIALVVERSDDDQAASQLIDSSISMQHAIKPSALLADAERTTFAAVYARERKTLNDLASSLRRSSSVPGEQHLSSQMARLLSFCEVTGARPGLLVEGYMAHALTGKPMGSMNEDSLHTYMTHIDLRDGISAWQSADVFDSARLVLKEARYIAKHHITPQAWLRLPRGTSEPHIAVKKADNYDARRYYQSILMAVPQMSAARAQAIAEVYPNVPTLVAALAAAPTPTAAVNLIANIRVKNRRLGDALAVRVVDRYGPQGDDDSSSSSEEEEEQESSDAEEIPSPEPAAQLREPPPAPRRPPPRRAAQAARLATAEELNARDDDSSSDDEEFIVGDGDDEEEEEEEDKEKQRPPTKRRLFA